MATCYDCMHYEICSIDGYVEPDKCTYFIKTPKVDVKEVKRGKWVSNRPNPDAMKKFHELGIGKAMSIHSVYWTCSECGMWGTPSGKFCSECGADMRGKTK